MTCQLYPFILKSYIPQPYLPCHRYKLFFISPHYYYNLTSLVSTWLFISTSFFWSSSLTRHMWAKQIVCFDPRPTREDYLKTNAFLNLVLVEQKEHPHALQKATREGATSKVVKETVGWTRPCLTLGMSTSASIIHHTIQWVGVTAE